MAHETQGVDYDLGGGYDDHASTLREQHDRLVGLVEMLLSHRSLYGRLPDTAEVRSCVNDISDHLRFEEGHEA